jgi:hypothetical protein
MTTKQFIKKFENESLVKYIWAITWRGAGLALGAYLAVAFAVGFIIGFAGL